MMRGMQGINFPGGGMAPGMPPGMRGLKGPKTP
ncbi:MAG: hypothetical protein CM15mP120_21440 [Pseudomonadota bacterium]|nr:MAG: hypothetical protein CM15mP120_21440 [Pseudomonadota bacterium]